MRGVPTVSTNASWSWIRHERMQASSSQCRYGVSLFASIGGCSQVLPGSTADASRVKLVEQAAPPGATSRPTHASRSSSSTTARSGTRTPCASLRSQAQYPRSRLEQGTTALQSSPVRRRTKRSSTDWEFGVIHGRVRPARISLLALRKRRGACRSERTTKCGVNLRTVLAACHLAGCKAARELGKIADLAGDRTSVHSRCPSRRPVVPGRKRPHVWMKPRNS